MDNIKTLIDGNTIKERFKPTIVLSYAMMAFMILSGTLICLMMILDYGGFSAALVPVIAFSLLMVYIFAIIIKGVKNLIKRYKDDPINSEVAFNEDHLILHSYRGDDYIGFDKVYYRECNYFVTTKNFVFLYIRNGTFTPVTKSDDVESLLLLKGVKKRK